MFVLEVHTESESWADLDAELAEILRNAADRVAAGQASGELQNARGNKVGSFSMIGAQT